MKVGLQLPWFDFPATQGGLRGQLRDIARRADEAGFASLWVMDHFFMIAFDSPPFPRANTMHDPMLEAYTTLGYLAGVTERVRLGAMVGGVIYRYPGILVKTATTLDVLSGGRSYFGIGAGWYEEEARGLGTPFPGTGTRFEMLEETIQIAKQMWESEPGSARPFEGKHYQLTEPISSPQPVTRPHPPILIGGGGERKTLRLVAQYADACNLNMGPGPDSYPAALERIRHKLNVLRAHCDAVGRDFDTIERTSLGTVQLAPGAMTAADVITALRNLSDAGIQHAIVNMPNAYDPAPLESFAREIIPAVAEL
jgi:F420-dependent oxidoreductase-like protein